MITMCMMTIAAKSYGFKNYVCVWAATAHTLNVIINKIK